MNLNTEYRTLHAVAALWAVTAISAQWDFLLDTTFRTDITRQGVSYVEVMPTGELLLSGNMRFLGELNDRALAKLDQNGDRVISFPFTYGGGKLVSWMDRYYVAGGQTVRRLLPSGLVDTDYISMNSGPYVSSLQGGDYHVFPDGRVLLSGSHQLSDTTRGFVGFYDLIWFGNSGYLDTTRIHRQSDGTMWEFVELPNGKFICSCSCSQYEGQPVDKVFRIHPDGTLDTTFHSGITAGNIYAYYPLTDGRVYVGGNFRRAAAPNDTLFLVRLLPDGSLDPTFDNPQLTIPNYIPIPSSCMIRSIRPWGDDAIIASGQFDSADGHERWGMCMLDTTGQVLPAFGTCEIGPFTYQGNTNVAIMDWTYGLDSTSMYVCGYYTGYDDGTINDTLQRFVSRLLVEELSTAVDDGNERSPSLYLYPNPSDRTVLIDWGLTDATASSAELTVMTAQGQLVHTAQVSLAKKGYSLVVSAYPAGLYHLHLVADGQWVSGCKMVVE